MVQVTDLLNELKQDTLTTDATLAFFKRSTDLKLSQDFPTKPDRMDNVVDALMKLISARS